MAHAGCLTVGHSNLEMTAFLSLLRNANVDVIADVRSNPRSGYSPQFDRAPLERSLSDAGIKYVFLGHELGGRPNGDEFYDSEDHVRYDRVASATFFKEGLRRLRTGMEQFNVAIMCSEGDPTDCHRRLLIARVLDEQGIEVKHLRLNGELQGADAFPSPDPVLVQPGLFGEEVSTWRSARPVSRDGRPETFSEH